MEFVCKNPECPRYGKLDYYSQVSVVIKNGEPFVKQSPCPSCGNIREEVKKEAPESLKGIYFGKFRAMSKEQKQESLKKRSHEHFKKNIQAEKEAKLATVRKQGDEMLKR